MVNSEKGGVAPPHPAMVKAYGHEWLHNERIFVPLVDYNTAYILTARDQGHVPPDAARALVFNLRKLREEGIDALSYRLERDGLQPNLEAEVTRRIGPQFGGWLSIGRARQECELVARQIAERDDLLALMGKAADLLSTLIVLTRREADTVMPSYTWAQHAEPITFGYYADATAHAIAADCSRLEQAFSRLDMARAGAGQVVPPPFELDRERLARLLGFSGVLPNSMHAYSSLDIEIAVLSAIAIFCAQLARMAETLLVWASLEFGFLRFAPEFTGTSYAMPQKQNPYALRLVRPVASRATGAFNDALQLFSGSLQIVGNGVIHIPNRVISLLSEVADLCDLLSAALPTLAFDKERMRRGASTGWAEAPQLVYHLVRHHGISFRQAHEVCGLVVSQALKDGHDAGTLPAEIVEAAVHEVTSESIVVDLPGMRRALEPESIVASRVTGGPAPESVRKDADSLEAALGDLHRRIEAKRARLDGAARELAESADGFG